MSDLPFLATNPKTIVFTDWDGTVTLQDSNDAMTDNLGFGVEKRKALNQKVLEETMSFRDSFDLMLDSIDRPFPECVEYLKQHVQLDPGFAEFYKWCHANNIPLVVVSSGMKPIIEALLTQLVGEAAVGHIPIIANDVKIDGDNWKIVYRDESGFGHDKSRSLRPYAQLDASVRPTLFYCGDGVSDLSAARETDLLFAKRGRDLVTYCEREKIPHTLFDSFSDIHKLIKDVHDGKTTLQDINRA